MERRRSGSGIDTICIMRKVPSCRSWSLHSSWEVSLRFGLSVLTLGHLLKERAEIKKASVPFFIKPITRGIADRVDNAFLNENFKTQFDFLEQQLATSPQKGDFFCGPNLTGADIMMIFPLEAGSRRAGITPQKYPKLAAFVERIHAREAYQRAVKKVEEATGEKFDMTVG